VQNFRELQVWQRAHDLTLSVYRLTASFPAQEMYGLTSQMRRSCVSIPANIAEGCGRDGAREFARFLEIARGSASELEYYLLLASDLHFLAGADRDKLAVDLTELQKILASLRHRVMTAPLPPLKTQDS
jgi:four helix bundle protein